MSQQSMQQAEAAAAFAEQADYFLWLWLKANGAPDEIVALLDHAGILHQQALWIAGDSMPEDDRGTWQRSRAEALAGVIEIMTAMGVTWPRPECFYSTPDLDLAGWGLGGRALGDVAPASERHDQAGA